MSDRRLVHIIDDDDDFRKGIERLLRACGMEVETFSSAEAFQADADLAEATCLILDIHLNGISGIELAQKLSKSGTRVAIVFVTASDSERTREAALAAGCAAYLQKPITAEALMDALGRATSS